MFFFARDLHSLFPVGSGSDDRETNFVSWNATNDSARSGCLILFQVGVLALVFRVFFVCEGVLKGALIIAS